jgi:hypothetical protein
MAEEAKEADTHESTETKREVPQADDGEGAGQGDAKRAKVTPSEDSKSKPPDQAPPNFTGSDPVMPWLSAIGGMSASASASHPGGVSSAVNDQLNMMYASGRLQPGELDDRCLAQLNEFTDTEAIEILNMFNSADLARARNKSAFFTGVIKRFRTLPKSGVIDSVPLPEGVDAFLQKMYDNGHLKHGDIDEACVRKLKSHPPQVALIALQRLSEADTASIRNVSAYFSNIIHKCATETMAGQGFGGVGVGIGQSFGMVGGMGMYGQGGFGQAGYAQAGYGTGAVGGFNQAQFAQMGGQYGQMGVLPSMAAGGLPFGALGGGGVSGGLKPSVQTKLHSMFSIGMIRQDQFDSKAQELLAQLPEELGLKALSQVEGAMMKEGIRNVAAYFTGIARKYLQGGSMGGNSWM